jgi:hypothetical protein
MKTPITWLELLKEKFNYMKKTTGKSVSVGDVAGEAKKEWVEIKEGRHPKYTQGKQQKTTRKNKSKKVTFKNEKQAAHTKSAHNNEDAVMKKIMLGCPKCMKKYNKLMKKTKKNKKNYKGGDEDEEEEEEVNTDVYMAGGGDNEAVETELAKESSVETEEAPETTSDKESVADTKAAAATKGGKKKRRSHKK